MIEVDVWVRGRQDAAIERIAGIESDAGAWTDDDVKKLLEGMLRALQRTNDPAGEPTPVTLRGFSWIVSPDDEGVLVHVEMQLGTVSAGPFAIDEQRLTDMISRVIGGPKVSMLVH
ncbi:MAG TPA: hypothetical protein VEC39_11470 [Vicinamibacterales bacterium]|nr:hypothetical protein [Vicinamibacterales bacterium]